MNTSTKLIVNLPTKALEGLRAHAYIHSITMTEALNRMLGLQSFIDKERATGSKLLMRRVDGSYIQILRGNENE